MTSTNLWDCVIIGGGPSGITAALYLARYRRKVIIFDTFNSRAELIPLSHNYPGFPEGISGKDLLNKLRKQLSAYNVPFMKETVDSIKQVNAEKFLVKMANKKIYTKNIILATGVKDIEPQLGDIRDGIQKGLIRHCPVCDAYEAMNKKIAIIAKGKSGLAGAVFLRDYTSDITLIILNNTAKWSDKELKLIKRLNISIIISREIEKMALASNYTTMTLTNQKVIEFDYIYSALGSVKNNKLAIDLKLKLKKGSLVVSHNQETSLKGVFAAGDIVSGLHQICVATSQAAIAASAIHERCRSERI